MNYPSVEALLAEGQAHENASRLAESVRCYQEALRIAPVAQAFWNLIGVQVKLAQFTLAAEWCERAIELYPAEVVFHLRLAQVKQKLGDRNGTLEILRGAWEAFPRDVEVARFYGYELIEAGHYQEAVAALERAIVFKPAADDYRMLAKIMRQAGDESGARRCLRAGRDRFPLDVRLAFDCFWFDEAAAAESVKAMRTVLPSLDAAARTDMLHFFTRLQALTNRKAAGLPVEVATGWIDLVQWADPDGLAAVIESLEGEISAHGPRAGAATVERAMAAVAQMDWEGAEHWFAQARAKPEKGIANVATFDPGFYSRLEEMTDEDISALFPPVCEVAPREVWPERIIYISCDPKYFELFAMRFLRSFAKHVRGAGVHFHLLDGAEEDWRRMAEMLRDVEGFHLSMTAETSWARENYGRRARDYYHAARYVRFQQYLVQNRRPAWILDVDLDVESDPEATFRLLDGHDFAVTTNALALEPWGKFQAGLVGIAPTAGGLNYLRLVAAYVSHWLERDALRWGIDQQALFGVYSHLARTGRAPKTRFLDARVLHAPVDQPGIFRSVVDSTRWEKGK